MISIAKVVAEQTDIDAVVDVLKSGMWAMGPKVTEFEQKFAEFSGVKHAIAVTNGTVAIQFALAAAGIRPGDRIITTPFTFIATSNCIVHNKAIPVFVDIDPKTFLIDLDLVEDELKKGNVKAIMVVSLFGQSYDGFALAKLAEKYGVILLEDCAQSQGAMFKNKHAGSFGLAGTHSFYGTKNLPTGEGGMVVTNDDGVNERVRRAINHGRLAGYEHVEVGYNGRMTSLIAALGCTQLAKLDENNDRRRHAASRYNEEIENPLLKTPFSPKNAHHVYHQYTLRVKKGRRDEFQQYLTANGVGSAIVYPKLSYQQVAFQRIGLGDFSCPHAELAVNEVISIPVHPRLVETEISTVIEVCNKFK